MYLPNEIWHSILSLLPTPDLLSCALVSRPLHPAATQLLYHDISIDTAWPVSLRRQAPLTPIMHRTPTRVRRHRELLHTIRKNPRLLQLIRSATFLMLGESSRQLVTGDVREIFRELAKSDIPVFIHLSCRLDMYWSFLAPYAQIKSLRLKTLMHHKHYAATFRQAAELKGLQHLTVADLPWSEPGDEGEEGEGEGTAIAKESALSQSEERFSDLKTLAFVNSYVPIGEEFELMLKWPAALRSFCYAFWSMGKTGTHTVSDPSIDVPQQFFRALSAQADTLEEVHIIGPDWQDLLTRPSPPPQAELLRSLTKVRKLSLPMNFLALPQRGIQVSNGESLATLITPPLHTYLPPLLEELQLQWPTSPDSIEMRDQEWRFSFKELANPRGFVDWLRGLAEEKAGSCPHLARVAVHWQDVHAADFTQLPSVDPVVVSELRRAYEAAEMELLVRDYDHGPFFSLDN